MNTEELLSELGLNNDALKFLQSFNIHTLHDVIHIKAGKLQGGKVRFIALSIKAMYQYLRVGNLTQLLKHRSMQPILETSWKRHLDTSKEHMDKILGHSSKDSCLREVCTILQNDNRIDSLRIRSSCISRIRVELWKLYFRSMILDISPLIAQVLTGEAQSTDVTFTTAPFNLTFTRLANFILIHCKEKIRKILYDGFYGDGFADGSSAVIAKSPQERKRFLDAKHNTLRRFDALCSIVSEKLCAANERNGGVVAGTELANLSAGAHKGSILLVLNLASPGYYWRFLGNCLTTIQVSTFVLAIKNIRHCFHNTPGYSISLDEAAKVLQSSTLKLKLSPEDAGIFLSDIFDSKLINNDRFIIAPFQGTSRRLTSILEYNARPMTLTEVRKAYDLITNSFPSLTDYYPGAPDTVQSLEKNPDILHLEENKWCHISALPHSPKELDRILDFCIQQMNKSMDSVSIQFLLDKYVKNGSKTPLSERLLVRLFRKDKRVHNTGPRLYSTVITGKISLRDRFEKILRRYKRPLTPEEIHKKLPAELGIKADKLPNMLIRISGDILRTYNGRFCLKTVAGTPAELVKLFDMAYKLLPKDYSPISCVRLERLLQRKSPDEKLFTLRSPALWLHALLKNNHYHKKVIPGPGRFEADRYGFIARNDQNRKGRLIDNFIAGLARKYSVIDRSITSSELMRELGYTPGNLTVLKASNQALSHCVKENILWRLPFGTGLYSYPDIDFPVLFLEIENSRRARDLIRSCHKNHFSRCSKRDLQFLSEFLRQSEQFELADKAAESYQTLSSS